MNTKALPTISKLPAAFIHIGCRRKLSASTYVFMYIPITILNLTWHYEYLMRKVKEDHCPKGNELICQVVSWQLCSYIYIYSEYKKSNAIQKSQPN